MILALILITIYIISLAICRLSMIMMGENDSKIVNLVSIVPIMNTVSAVIIIMLFGYIVKDGKKNKEKKSETTQN